MRPIRSSPLVAETLDRDWLAGHPLPSPGEGADKNARGRVLLAGGAHFVPGALRLTGEAALRAGAGKLQMATVREAAMPLGVLVPEAAMIALPVDEDGEIGSAAIPMIAEAMARCDAFILGPGMSGDADRLVSALLAQPRDGLTIILDAAAIPACAGAAEQMRRHAGRLILTPHHGEMAALTGRDRDYVAAHGEALARETAAALGAVIVLKSESTVIVAPDGDALVYQGGGVGLATGGSGDVLAGVAGGLAARGADPVVAAAWAVWLHGEAGRTLAETMGPIGFLARDLVALIPRLMWTAAAADRAIGF